VVIVLVREWQRSVIGIAQKVTHRVEIAYGIIRKCSTIDDVIDRACLESRKDQPSDNFSVSRGQRRFRSPRNYKDVTSKSPKVRRGELPGYRQAAPVHATLRSVL
jgi:hypothetical protein